MPYKRHYTDERLNQSQTVQMYFQHMTDAELAAELEKTRKHAAESTRPLMIHALDHAAKLLETMLAIRYDNPQPKPKG